MPRSRCLAVDVPAPALPVAGSHSIAARVSYGGAYVVSLLFLAAIPALLVGFVAGLVTYRKSRRWCVVCGATLRCPDCAARTSGRLPAAGSGHRVRRPGP